MLLKCTYGISHLGNLHTQNIILLNNNKRITPTLLLLHSFESITLTDTKYDLYFKKKRDKWKESQKTTYYCMISLIWKIQNKQVHKRQKVVQWLPRAGEEGDERGLLMSLGFFMGWWKYSTIRQQWWLHNSVNTVNTTKLYVSFKSINFMAHELYLNNTIKKRSLIKSPMLNLHV